MDECVAGSIVRALRGAGHDVVWSAETTPGQSDEQILTCSVADDRLLVTRDQDFGDLVFLNGMTAVGIIRIRFEMKADAASVAEETLRRIESLGEAALRGCFTVFSEDGTRQRELPGEMAGR